METKQFKPNGYSRGLVIAAAGLLGLMVVAGLTRAVRVCVDHQQEVVDAENNLQAVIKVQEIERINHFVRLINEGRADEVKRIMSLDLAEGVAGTRAAATTATGGSRTYVMDYCDLILRDEKAHPEHYLTAEPEAQLAERRAWEAAGAEAVRPAGPTGPLASADLARNN